MGEIWAPVVQELLNKMPFWFVLVGFIIWALIWAVKAILPVIREMYDWWEMKKITIAIALDVYYDKLTMMYDCLNRSIYHRATANEALDNNPFAEVFKWYHQIPSKMSDELDQAIQEFGEAYDGYIKEYSQPPSLEAWAAYTTANEKSHKAMLALKTAIRNERIRITKLRILKYPHHILRNGDRE